MSDPFDMKAWSRHADLYRQNSGAVLKTIKELLNDPDSRGDGYRFEVPVSRIRFFFGRAPNFEVLLWSWRQLENKICRGMIDGPLQNADFLMRMRTEKLSDSDGWREKHPDDWFDNLRDNFRDFSRRLGERRAAAALAGLDELDLSEEKRDRRKAAFNALKKSGLRPEIVTEKDIVDLARHEVVADFIKQIGGHFWGLEEDKMPLRKGEKPRRRNFKGHMADLADLLDAVRAVALMEVPETAQALMTAFGESGNMRKVERDFKLWGQAPVRTETFNHERLKPALKQGTPASGPA